MWLSINLQSAVSKRTKTTSENGFIYRDYIYNYYYYLLGLKGFLGRRGLCFLFKEQIGMCFEFKSIDRRKKFAFSVAIFRHEYRYSKKG